MAKASFLDSPNLPIILLGGAGVYALYRGGFFAGLSRVGEGAGQVAEGLGTAVQGAGAGVSELLQGIGSGGATIGREAGDIVVDVGSIFEPLAAVSQGLAGNFNERFREFDERLKRESSQSNVVDVEAFEQSKDRLSEIQAEKEINKATESSTRSGLIQDQLTDVTRGFTRFDELISEQVQKGKAALAALFKPSSNVVLGGMSAEFSSRLKSDETRSLTTPKEVPRIVLPTSSASSLFIPSSSSGGGSSSAPLPKSQASFIPTPKPSTLEKAMGVTFPRAPAQIPAPKPSLVEKFKGWIGRIF